MNLARAARWAMVKAGLALLKTSGSYKSYFGEWRGRPFDAAERMGLHVMPAHYYSPVPTVSRLDAAVFRDRNEITGIDLNVPKAVDFVKELARDFGAEYAKFEKSPGPDRRRYHLANTGFGAGDAEGYYGMLRRFKPRRVIEIGCGNSSLAAALALAKNREEGAPDCKYTCIEPYLPDYLRPLPDPAMEVIERGVEALPLEMFESLGDGDFLFIDSTHVAAFGSDCVYEYLEILPRLKPGVIVHIHDIFFPRDYPRDWIVAKRYFWNEQYLLQAFLLHNSDYEVVLPLHALYALRRDDLIAAIPSIAVAKAPPASFWMRKKDRLAPDFRR